MPINGNNKRIAKNTLILYLRMLFTMFIVLYTSRIVLSALGIEDYGLYQTICGLAAMFSFLMTGMTTSTQRFLSFHIGSNDRHALRQTFGHCMATHLLIAGTIPKPSALSLSNSPKRHERKYTGNWLYRNSLSGSIRERTGKAASTCC